MPYAPGIQDRSGELLASGLSDAFDSISRGISDYRREQKRKEDEQAAVDFLKQNGARLGLNVNDDKELQAAVKAAGGGPQAVQVFGAMQEMEQRKAAADQQRQLVAAQLDAAKRNALAATAAGKASPEQAVADYLRNGGSPQGADQLAAAFANMERMRAARAQFNPALVDLGEGVTAMTTSRSSAVPIQRGAGGAPNPFSPAGKLLADADALEAAGRKDDADLLRKIARKQGDARPMSLQDFIVSGGQPEDYRAYYDSVMAKDGSGGAPAKAPAMDKEIPTVTPDEARKLRKGTKFMTTDGRLLIKQ